MLYKEWIDFVVYSSDADKVKTRQQRLDTRNAISNLDVNFSPEIAKQNGLLIDDHYLLTRHKDQFEAAWITDDGDVFIWTQQNVWTIHRRIDGKEKLVFVPRNPDIEVLSKLP